MFAHWGIEDRLVSDEEYEARTQRYREWWKPYEKQILTALCEILDLEFRQNTVDVYVAPWKGAMSDPLILPSNFESQDRLIRVLTHELAHRLLADNTASSRFEKHDFEQLKKLYGEKPFAELVHIPVHAIMKYVYVEVLQRQDLLATDIQAMKDENKQDYSNAWEYVDAHDYKEIIHQARMLLYI